MAGARFTKKINTDYLSLQNSSALQGLTTVQLITFSRYGIFQDYEVGDDRPIENLSDKFVFIISGKFQSIYYIDQEAIDKRKVFKEKATVLETLAENDLWGINELSEEHENLDDYFGLRSVEPGRIFIMNKNAFLIFLEKIPVINENLRRMLSKKAIDNSVSLGELKYKQESTDYVLNRIEDLAITMMRSGEEGSDETIQIQKKYKLKNDFKLDNKLILETHLLEQAYLKVEENTEDRIRKTQQKIKGQNDTYRYINDSYSRTTKAGKGASKKVFNRTITAKEYYELEKKKLGNLVIKERNTLSLKKDKANNEEYILDTFSKELSGLIMLEVTFNNEKNLKKFTLPKIFSEYIIEEVTENSDYNNKNLALNTHQK